MRGNGIRSCFVLTTSHVDSGNETIESEDSLGSDTETMRSTPECCTKTSSTHSLAAPPPKITPVGGIADTGKVLLKPKAFKPVARLKEYFSRSSSFNSPLPSHNGFASMADIPSSFEGHITPDPTLALFERRYCNSVEDVHCPSRPSRRQESRISPMSDLGSSYFDHPAKLGIPYPPTGRNFIGGSMNNICLFSSKHGTASNAHSDSVSPNSSPSDSGIVDLDSVLREKDSEINYLRSTMEHNEKAIFKVYEEKERVWEREVEKVRSEYEQRIRSYQQRSHKAEQMLLTQAYQFLQEKRKLKLDIEALEKTVQDRDEVFTQLKKENEVLTAQLDETRWTVCEKTGEISLLKSQLKDFQESRASRDQEMLILKSQYRDEIAKSKIKTEQIDSLREEVACFRNAISSLIRDGSTDGNTNCVEANNIDLIEKLRKLVGTFHSQLRNTREELESQSRIFSDEKERVITYQKKLQLGYWNMYHKNLSLEKELTILRHSFEGSDDSECNRELSLLTL